MAGEKQSVAAKWSGLLPDTELLKQWQGVEEGLRRRRALGRVGWLGALAAAIAQVAVTVLDSSWLKALQNLNLAALKSNWYLALPLILALVFLLLYRWSRYWLQESEQPFRYTCSIEAFTPVADAMREPKLEWLSHHLTRRMNERIGRLRFADEPKSAGDESSSHIHVRGHYLFREDSAKHPLVEVFLRVRIGGVNRPETLAHPVLLMVGPAPAAGAGMAAGPKGAEPEGSRLTVEQYELLLERVYFSAASEIYRQIREDVANKLELLPARRFKAVALFHEAEDYARSCTLDAYEEARALYERCARLLDPALEPLPEQPLRRRVALVLRTMHAGRERLRRFESHLRPVLAREDVLCARADLGYAMLLLQSNVIASISGQRVNAVFEAPAVARRAIGRLKEGATDAVGRGEALFRGYVVMAWACQTLGDQLTAHRWLAQARTLDPAMTERDALFNLVAGLLAPRATQRIETLSRALELQPGFEAAAFQLTMAKEDLWRSRPTFERQGAVEIIELYGRLVTTNPGLIGAWANRGYLRWLVATDDSLALDLEEAERHFSNGRQYKEIKQATFVAELDYGLARIAAELGDFDTAHLHCAEIASSMFSAGLSFTNYYFNLIGPDMVRRFERYCSRVEQAWQARCAAGTGVERRVCDSVMAFVLNDCGEAYYQCYWRTGDERYLKKAREAHTRAVELDSEFPGAYLNLAKLDRYQDDHAAVKHLERCLELSPNWPDAICEMASAQGRLVRELETRATDSRENQTRSRDQARREREEARAKQSAARAKAREPLIREPVSRREPSSTPRGGATQLPGSPSAAFSAPVPLARQDLPIADLGAHDWAGARHAGAEAEREDNDIRDRLERAKGLIADAWKARREARELHVKAAQAERKTRAFAQRLLPHRWLWVDGAAGEERELDWSAFRRTDLEAELRWEREFNDWNALALSNYVEALVMRPTPTSRRKTAAAPSELLAFVRRHFWPARVDSLLALRHANGKLEAYDEAALRAVIEGWVASDPANYSTLRWWITDEVIVSGPEVVLRSVARNDLSPAALIWAAEYLEGQGELQGALQACQAALAKGDAQTLPRVGLCCERLKAWGDARATWARLLEAVPADDAMRVDAVVGLAVALWMQEEQEAALRALQGIANADPATSDWRATFVSRIDLAGLDRGARALLRCWLESQLRLQHPTARADAGSALLSVAASTQVTPRPPDDSGEPGQPLLPLVTPIVLEGDAALFENNDAQALLERIGPMRERIVKDLGVQVPGVRVRINEGDLAPDSYVVSVDEVPIALATVYPDRLVCPDWPRGTQLPDPDLPKVFNPLTGQTDAVVVPREGRAALAAQGRTLWDQWDYMTRHLESLVRLYVGHFFGLQEMHNLLEEWSGAGETYKEDEAREALIERVLPNTPARVALTGALHDLLQQQVRITDVAAALQAFEQQYPQSPDAYALVEAIRWKLRKDLSVKRVSPSLIGLSEELEQTLTDALVAHNGKTLFLMTPAATTRLIEAVRATVEDLTLPALVVQNARVRQLLWRLIRVEFPRMPVFAVRELPRELRGVRAATVQAA